MRYNDFKLGLFTPDLAFERIVKEQVEQLATAPTNTVDQVQGWAFLQYLLRYW